MFCNGSGWSGGWFPWWGGEGEIFVFGMLAVIALVLALLFARGRGKQVSGEALCPSCAGAIRSAYFRCPHCGKFLKSNCSGCSRVVEVAWSFCPFCSQALHQKPGNEGEPGGISTQ